MTNGEKIKEIFPNTKIITQYDNPFGDRFIVFTLNNEDMEVNLNWWNAEYKEPTTNDLEVDCISRKRVLEWLENATDDSIEHAIDSHLEFIPSITPIRPKGHWISHREHCENLGVMPSGLGAYEWCSNCDCGIDVREWHRNHYNFCPNCGADMREVEE